MDCFLDCSCCGATWKKMEDALRDPALELIGYQINKLRPNKGLFLFNHIAGDCGSTLALEVGMFKQLSPQPDSRKSLWNTENCPGHCGRIEDLARCERPCSNAWVRELAVKIRDS